MLDECGWLTPRPCRITFSERGQGPTANGAAWIPKAGQDWCGKSRPAPGFNPRTVQLVASHYIGWAIATQKEVLVGLNLILRNSTPKIKFNFQIRNFCNSPIPYGTNSYEFPAFYEHDHFPNLIQSNPAHTFVSHFFKLSKPSGAWCTNRFNIQQFYALPTLYLCVLYLSENKQRPVPLTA